jgi:DNA-binding winged helix-turn-helix (wHTH) protein
VHVRRLRAKLGSDHETLIGTVRNVGYRFVLPKDPTELPAAAPVPMPSPAG